MPDFSISNHRLFAINRKEIDRFRIRDRARKKTAQTQLTTHRNILIFVWNLGKTVSGARDYYGAHLGPLSQLHHGVSGDVYAVDSRTLFLKNFNYDGEGPGKT